MGAYSLAFAQSFAVAQGGGFTAAFSAAFGRSPDTRKLICPQQAQAAMLAGAACVLSADGMLVGDALLIAQSGKPMNFKSEETAASYVEVLTLRAAGEAGIVALLPEKARHKWSQKKAVSLRNYAERIWKAAARWAENTPERAALITEASAADARADSLTG